MFCGISHGKRLAWEGPGAAPKDLGIFPWIPALSFLFLPGSEKGKGNFSYNIPDPGASRGFSGLSLLWDQPGQSSWINPNPKTTPDKSQLEPEASLGLLPIPAPPWSPWDAIPEE